MTSRPAPAATIVLLRDGRTGVEVYLVQRPAGASFMAGAHVFPGGRLEPADADPEYLTRALGGAALRERVEPVLGAERTDNLEAAGLAVVRELFEEAGLLLARLPSGATPDDAALAAWRDARGTAAAHAHGAWQRLLAGTGARPALDALVVLGRWITPEAEPRRFDTWFFLARSPDAQTSSPDGREAVAELWASPADAIARHAAGTLRLAPPTLRTLEELARLAAEGATAGAMLEAAARRPPSVILPHALEQDGRLWLVLPGDPRYPGAPPVDPAPRAFVLDGDRWRSA
jgi:8-oxo-dGTP pyrophosphatase MutT (NUDIX family)